ncbi:MAG TPA: hypothetical protein VGF96_19185 [Terracidiphilus sp.]|jgi:hypothetical protein
MKAKSTLLIACAACLSMKLIAADTASLNQRIRDARDVIRQITMTPDKAIPNGIARQATSVGVIPSVKKQLSS